MLYVTMGRYFLFFLSKRERKDLQLPNDLRTLFHAMPGLNLKVKENIFLKNERGV